MSQNQPQSLDDIIERFKREISDHAAAERARVTAAADAAINRIHELEASLGERPGPAAEELRVPRRFERSVEPDPGKDIPAGAVLMARRMADEGHTRGEVAEFLAENFRRIDVPAAVDHAFQDASAAS
ncbi:MAG TPA: hypothetical protein VFY44_09410 [Thermoleophilaceae bacterium]|nr:hypothetical protein [Thermoleophilaceae bacterium]